MTHTDTGHLSQLLRQFRQKSAISQEELAERSTVSVRTISDLERGIRETARLDTVRLLAGGLELSNTERAALIDAAIVGSSVHGNSSGRLTTKALPVFPNELIGRTSLVEEIVGFIDSGEARLLTLTGPGGVGKTRVAIEVASRIAPRSQSVVVFVSLAPVLDTALIPVAIAQTLGISTSSVSPEENVSNFLAKRDVLLVLDNFEHLLDEASLITRLSEAGSRVTILTTSRSRLRLTGEREIAIPPLELPEVGASIDAISKSGAVQLFAERADIATDQRELLDQHAEIVAEICRRVDGLPLSIELAASKLRVMSPDTLLEMLKHRLPVLTGGNRDQPARHRSMRETIGWSYGLLSEEQQTLFRWLAVYVGGFSSAAVAHTGQTVKIDSVVVYEALDGLLDATLIQRFGMASGEPRFRMLETIREFGIEQLEAHGEYEDARMSHARFVYELVADGAPTPVLPIEYEWLQRIEKEDANVVSAFDWICRPETASFCIELTSVLGGYWDCNGPYRESAARLRAAAEFAFEGQSLSAARTLFWASGLSMYAGEFDLAPRYGEAALAMARELGSLEATAFATHTLAWHAELSSDWVRSTELFGQANELWTELGEDAPRGQILMQLGGGAYEHGDFVRARELEEEAMALFEKLDDADFLASVEWYLGFISMAEGKVHEAAAHYQRSLEYWPLYLSTTFVFKPLIHLADVAVATGDWETAAILVGGCDHFLEAAGGTLFPFDVPSWERATTRSRDALGDEAYAKFHAMAPKLSPSEWLDLVSIVVQRAAAMEE